MAQVIRAQRSCDTHVTAQPSPACRDSLDRFPMEADDPWRVAVLRFPAFQCMGKVGTHGDIAPIRTTGLISAGHINQPGRQVDLVPAQAEKLRGSDSCAGVQAQKDDPLNVRRCCRIESVQLRYRWGRNAPGRRCGQTQTRQRTYFQHIFPHSPVAGCPEYACPTVCRALLKPAHPLSLHKGLHVVRRQGSHLSTSHEPPELTSMISVGLGGIRPDVWPGKIGCQNFIDGIAGDV